MTGAHQALDADTAIILAIDGQYDTAENELYVIDFWLPIVGPTAYAIRDVALSHGRDWELTIDELAWKVGISPDRIIDNLWRARRLGFWSHEDRFDECVWTIPRLAPVIPPGELAKRSAAFRDAHSAFVEHGTAHGIADGLAHK